MVGVGSSTTLLGSSRRLMAMLLASAAAGAASIGVLHGWLQVLDGSVLTEMGVVAAGIAAIALVITGMRTLVGVAGTAVGSVLVLFLGNPLSAATSAPELLPAGWSTLGQALPPGAMTSAALGLGLRRGRRARSRAGAGRLVRGRAGAPGRRHGGGPPRARRRRRPGPDHRAPGPSRPRRLDHRAPPRRAGGREGPSTPATPTG